MEYDIFGNAIIDSRSLTRIKIDELWDLYCELFNTCISLDDFALTEEDMLNIMSRSIEEKKDYLSNFILSNNQSEDERETLIFDIADHNFSELLRKAYDGLELFNCNLEEQYMILKMIYERIKKDEEKGCASFNALIDELQKKNLSELLEIANEYQWWPAEIIELRKIRMEVLQKVKNRNPEEKFFIDEIKDELERIYSVIQVTNYKYVGREKVLNEYTVLKNDIKKACDYLLLDDSFMPSDKSEEEVAKEPIFNGDGFSKETSFEMKPFSDKK